MRGSILKAIGHVTIWKKFISFIKRLIASKSGRVLTYGMTFSTQMLKSPPNSCSFMKNTLCSTLCGLDWNLLSNTNSILLLFSNRLYVNSNETFIATIDYILWSKKFDESLIWVVIFLPMISFKLFFLVNSRYPLLICTWRTSLIYFMFFLSLTWNVSIFLFL